MDDGARHPRREQDDSTERQQNGPHRVEGHRGDRLADEGQGHCGEPDDRGDTGEGNDGEIRHDTDRRELVEVSQGDRQHRHLGGRAHADRAGDYAARQRRGHDAEGRRERQLEARVEEVARADGEDGERRQGETVGDRRVSIQERGEQDEHGHDDGAEHGRLGAHHQRERDHHDDRGHGRRTMGHAQESAERPDRRGQDPDVEAGDGQDVIDAGAPEGVVDVAGELGPVAEQEPGEQRRRRGRQRAPDGRDRVPLDAHRPRRRRIVQGRHGFSPRGRHHVDAFAREVRRVVEGPGVAEAHRPVEPERSRDALTFRQRR